MRKKFGFQTCPVNKKKYRANFELIWCGKCDNNSNGYIIGVLYCNHLDSR